MRKVTLRTVWEFTCEDCGRDIVVREPELDPEMVPDEDLDEILEAFGYDDPPPDLYKIFPDVVECPFCNVSYDAYPEDFEDLDEDSDYWNDSDDI